MDTYVKEIQPCAIHFNYDLVFTCLRFRCIVRNRYFRRMGVFLDYEGFHSNGLKKNRLALLAGAGTSDSMSFRLIEERYSRRYLTRSVIFTYPILFHMHYSHPKRRITRPRTCLGQRENRHCKSRQTYILSYFVPLSEHRPPE